jgi:hypothetical protein
LCPVELFSFLLFSFLFSSLHFFLSSSNSLGRTKEGGMDDIGKLGLFLYASNRVPLFNFLVMMRSRPAMKNERFKNSCYPIMRSNIFCSWKSI